MHTPIHDRLTKLGIVLPPPPKPVGMYKSAIAVGNRLLVSGHGPWVDGKPIKGKLGADMDVDGGKYAARHVGLGILATIENNVGLERVEQLVKTLGMVNAAPYFKDHPQVIDGFSQLMIEVFGEDAGVGSRSAVGHVSLPFGIAVEVECEFLLK